MREHIKERDVVYKIITLVRVHFGTFKMIEIIRINSLIKEKNIYIHRSPPIEFKKGIQSLDYKGPLGSFSQESIYRSLLALAEFYGQEK